MLCDLNVLAYRSISEMLEHVWCDLADDEVVHPVGGSYHASATFP
jgi:hypothetical protein